MRSSMAEQRSPKRFYVRILRKTVNGGSSPSASANFQTRDRNSEAECLALNQKVEISKFSDPTIQIVRGVDT